MDQNWAHINPQVLRKLFGDPDCKVRGMAYRRQDSSSQEEMSCLLNTVQAHSGPERAYGCGESRLGECWKSG